MLDAEYEVPDREVCKWAAICHLGGLASLTIIPFANVIVPSVVWWMKRDVHPYINEQGREAINFQISIALYFLLVSAGVWLLKIILIGHLLFWLPGLVFIAGIGGAICGAMRAHDGGPFQYPLILRFL